MKDALATKMTTLPEQLRRSLTWDRGKELSQHAAFKVETGIPVYFADPRSPWQRGSNENTNGLLRQYFPKGTDLSRWNAEEIDAVAAMLNSCPAVPPRLEDSRRGLQREHLLLTQRAGAFSDRLELSSGRSDYWIFRRSMMKTSVSLAEIPGPAERSP